MPAALAPQQNLKSQVIGRGCAMNFGLKGPKTGAVGGRETSHHPDKVTGSVQLPQVSSLFDSRTPSPARWLSELSLSLLFVVF